MSIKQLTLELVGVIVVLVSPGAWVEINKLFIETTNIKTCDSKVSQW